MQLPIAESHFILNAKVPACRHSSLKLWLYIHMVAAHNRPPSVESGGCRIVLQSISLWPPPSPLSCLGAAAASCSSPVSWSHLHTGLTGGMMMFTSVAQVVILSVSLAFQEGDSIFQFSLGVWWWYWRGWVFWNSPALKAEMQFAHHGLLRPSHQHSIEILRTLNHGDSAAMSDNSPVSSRGPSWLGDTQNGNAVLFS